MVGMGLLPDTQNCGSCMRWEYPERFPCHRLQRKLIVSDHGTCVTHVSWCMSGSLARGGGENVPGIPGARATCNFMYLARGPWAKVCLAMNSISVAMTLYRGNGNGAFWIQGAVCLGILFHCKPSFFFIPFSFANHMLPIMHHTLASLYSSWNSLQGSGSYEIARGTSHCMWVFFNLFVIFPFLSLFFNF